MNKKLLFLSFVIMISSLITETFTHAGEPREKGKSKDTSIELQKVTGQPRSTLLNINALAQWWRADGMLSRDPRTGQSGVFFPRGLGPGAAVIFADGFVWGGLVQDGRTPELRAGGNTFNVGLIEGAILPGGVAEDPNASDVRIWRIRRDYATADLALDAEELELDVATVRAQYGTDWREWPWQKGAPWTGIGNKLDGGYLGADGETIMGAGNGVLDRGEDANSNAILDDGEDANGNGVLDGEVPGIVGADQVVWTVANDLTLGLTTGFLGAPPIGLEVQITGFGFNQTGALGHMVFKQEKIIYKGTATTPPNARIDSMFVAQWVDPDLGTFSDDFVGVDTTLSLGFVYNSSSVDNTFRGFGLPPPAAGYDFFQGPLVPGDADDVGLFNFQPRPGFKNLPMTSFAFFAAGSQISDPPLGNFQGTIEWFTMLNGFLPQSDPANPEPFQTSDGQPTKFPLAGDPVAGSGDLDGAVLPPGDRRMVMSTGPFTLALGDTQEIVEALIVALGSDRLSSVAVLKFFDRTAQATFDNLFQVPNPPAAPNVRATGTDGNIILNWGFDAQAVAATEGQDESGFKFEGYNVYQLRSTSPDLSSNNATKLATFDLVNEVTTILSESFDLNTGVILQLPVQVGTNSGIERFFTITEDALRDLPIANDQDFFFALTAYNFTDDPLATTRSLESTPVILTVRAQMPNPGTRLEAEIGDAIEVAHIGPSDGSVAIKVLDPTIITGDDYRVFFTVDTTGGANTPLWHLENTTTGEIILANQTNQTGDPNIGELNSEGFVPMVTGAPNDFKLFQVVANASGPLDPPVAGALDFADFPTGVDASGTPLRPGDDQQATGDGRWAFHTGDNGGSSGGGTRDNFSDFKDRVARNDNFDRIVPFDFEMRFTGTDGNWGNWWFEDGITRPVPFELWHIGPGTPDDPSDDFRMIPRVLSNEGVGAISLDPLVYQLDPNDHSGSGADNDPYTAWVYWANPADTSPGTAGYDEFVAAGTDGVTPTDAAAGVAEVMARTVLVNWNGGDVFDPTFPANITQLLPEVGTIFRITSTKPNSPADEFTFSTAAFAKTENDQLKKQDALEMINVFPNPYIGFNRLETNRFNRFMRFTHLPERATVRIFNLAGTLARTLEKNDPSPWLDWNLQNENQLPVASGLYLAHIEMPGIGQKILKVIIVQEQEFLDTF